jgi:phosphatidate cytidylyltransferase
MENIGCKPIKFVGYLSSLFMFLICSKDKLKKLGVNIEFLINPRTVLIGVFLVLLILFCYIVFLHTKYNISDLAATVFGVWYIVFLFSFVILIRNMSNGFYYVWLIFIGAFATDTFAYFTGKLLGRHKLYPQVSPNKTIEGAIGGVIGCTLISIFYFNYLSINKYSYIIIFSVYASVFSMVGDLTASKIKREFGIKDFGNCLPGHGGMLDRFDSLLFVAPIVYYFVNNFI